MLGRGGVTAHHLSGVIDAAGPSVAGRITPIM
jgi:hypothetical protein